VRFGDGVCLCMVPFACWLWCVLVCDGVCLLSMVCCRRLACVGVCWCALVCVRVLVCVGIFGMCCGVFMYVGVCWRG